MEKEQELTLKKNKNSLDNMQLKIHNQMARTLARFEEPEYAKLFLISLGVLLKSEDNIAHINKIELFDKLNVPKEDKYKHKRYFDMLNSMRKRTEFNITIDEDTQIAGNIVYRIERYRHEYQIAFDDKITPVLKQLKNKYTLLYIDSIMQFKSSFSITLYNYLLSWHNQEYKINKQWLTTAKLKELFGLSNNDYMRKDGTFDRTNFEKYTIQKAVDEIAKSNYMYIQWYKAKSKLTRQVIAYVFEFIVIDNFQEQEDDLEFTEIKYGKVDDVVIRYEEELNGEPIWDNVLEKTQYQLSINCDDNLSEYDKWIQDYCNICDNIFSKTEMEEFNGMINNLPLKNMYSNSIIDDIYVQKLDYLIDKYRAFKTANSKNSIKNKYSYFKKMIEKDIEKYN